MSENKKSEEVAPKVKKDGKKAAEKKQSNISEYMILHRTLKTTSPRNILFGNICIYPTVNVFSPADSKLLVSHKDFEEYTEIGEWRVEYLDVSSLETIKKTIAGIEIEKYRNNVSSMLLPITKELEKAEKAQ